MDTDIEVRAREAGDSVSARRIMAGYWPRFARDAFGPVLAFYAGWKLGGVPLGIGLSTVVSMLVYRLEQLAGRRGYLARLSLGFVVVNAAVGLVADSAPSCSWPCRSSRTRRSGWPSWPQRPRGVS